MYEKNLTEAVRLRLAPTDMNFLRSLSDERGVSVSECIRSILGEYRRSVDALKTLQTALELAKKSEEEKEKLSHGDTKSHLIN